MHCCKACALSYVQHKSDRKVTTIRATKPGEQIFINVARPYTRAMEGICYIVQVVENYTRIGFCYFIRSRDMIGNGFKSLLKKLKHLDKNVEYIQCNSAGKNKKFL